MGDGRYYTFYQFFDVFLIMILVVLCLWTLVGIYYRKNENAHLSNIFLPLIAIVGFSLLRLVESVYPDLDLALSLRNMSLYVFLIILVCSNLWKFKFKKWFCLLCFLLLIVAESSFDLVSEYHFHEMVYSDVYKVLLVIAIVSSLIICFREMKMSELKGIDYLLFTIPIVFYCLMVFYESAYVDYMELATLLVMIFYIHLKFIKSDASSYTLLAFDKIGNMGTSYIFVVDEGHHIIYRNNAGKNPKVFQESSRLDSHDFSGLFVCDHHKKYSYKNKDYIELIIGEEKIYYSYNKTPLIDDQGLAGHIITFIDITELLNLLRDLQDKKAQSKMVNKQLMNYSKVVYQLEKEKEINKLLEEIITSRDQQMNYLSQLVIDAKAKLYHDCFEECIEVAIQKSNEILDDVRETVSKYRAYYGG